MKQTCRSPKKHKAPTASLLSHKQCLGAPIHIKMQFISFTVDSLLYPIGIINTNHIDCLLTACCTLNACCLLLPIDCILPIDCTFPIDCIFPGQCIPSSLASPFLQRVKRSAGAIMALGRGCMLSNRQAIGPIA